VIVVVDMVEVDVELENVVKLSEIDAVCVNVLVVKVELDVEVKLEIEVELGSKVEL
jgi:hypothetical protein